MKFHVELLAFGKPGEVREVDVPSVNGYPEEALHHALKNPVLAEMACAEVFHYGQNEVQPQDHPSVSAGDVIRLSDDERWICLPVGFKRLSNDEYEAYKAMPQVERMARSIWSEHFFDELKP